MSINSHLFLLAVDVGDGEYFAMVAISVFLPYEVYGGQGRR